MKHLDPQVRAVVVARLREQRAQGRLASGDVRAAATALAISERTLWRWLAEVDADREAVTARSSPRRYVLTEADRDAYMDWRGNVAALRRDRLDRGEAVPPLRTLQRAFAEQLSPGERDAAVDGVEGRRRHEVYLRWEPVARNARWEADHKELPVLVTPPRGARPVKPWATLFIDCYSRLIMGWALSLHPDSATVLAALRRGLVIDPDRGPFGGVPRVLVPDNGLEFVTSALGKVCGAVGILLDPTDAYTPPSEGQDREGELDSGSRVLVRVAVLHGGTARRGWASVRTRCPADVVGVVRRPVRRVGDRLQHGTTSFGAGRADSAAALER